MSDIAVIGLGDMGSALARALLKAGNTVTVWNRTASKAEPLLAEGAVWADSAIEAARSSPVVITCLMDYAENRALFGDGSVLAGKVFAELTTGTPKNARESEQWALGLGARFLDGAIMATPRQVGRPDTLIFFSGSRSTFDDVEPLLKGLAGNLAYMGEPVGSAAAWDLAFLSYAFGGFMGFLHGVRILESEGIPVDSFGHTVADAAPAIAEMVRYEGEVIQEERFENPESSLKVCYLGAGLILNHANEAGIDTQFPLFFHDYLKRGIDAGLGHLELGAMVKVLRESREVVLHG